MSKQRMVNTRFWSDEFVVELNPLDRYFFLYLLTNEHTTISGLYELPWRVMARETGLEDEMLKKMFNRLEGRVYHFDGWVWIRNFLRYQSLNPKTKIGIRREFEAIPKRIWLKIQKNQEAMDSLSKAIDSLCIGFRLSELKLESELESKSEPELEPEEPIATSVADSVEKSTKKSKPLTSLQQVVQYFFDVKGWPVVGAEFKKFLRAGKDVLSVCDGDVEVAKRKIDQVNEWAKQRELSWSLETVLKRWHELDAKTKTDPVKIRAMIDGDPAYKNARGDWMIVPRSGGEHVKWVGPLSEIKYVPR